MTNPIEMTIGRAPRVEEVRSVSKFGISVVTLVFEEGTDIYWARQVVSERITSAAAKIPPGFGMPELGPLTTALGEILQFEVRGEGYTRWSCGRFSNGKLPPRCARSSGSPRSTRTAGTTRPTKFARSGPAHQPWPDVRRCLAAVQGNNSSAGGGYFVHHDEQRFIRGQALLETMDDIRSIVIRRDEGGTRS